MAAGDPGGLVNVAGMGVLKATDDPGAANALVDYLSGPKGQQYFTDKTFEYPLAEGTQPNATLPPFSDLEPPALDLSDLDSLAETQKLLADVGLLTK
jgi:iron(III) transport system substrate-binding protein